MIHNGCGGPPPLTPNPSEDEGASSQAHRFFQRGGGDVTRGRLNLHVGEGAGLYPRSSRGGRLLLLLRWQTPASIVPKPPRTGTQHSHESFRSLVNTRLAVCGGRSHRCGAKDGRTGTPGAEPTQHNNTTRLPSVLTLQNSKLGQENDPQPFCSSQNTSAKQQRSLSHPALLLGRGQRSLLESHTHTHTLAGVRLGTSCYV